jgi:hypothetical protein
MMAKHVTKAIDLAPQLSQLCRDGWRTDSILLNFYSDTRGENAQLAGSGVSLVRFDSLQEKSFESRAGRNKFL